MRRNCWINACCLFVPFLLSLEVNATIYIVDNIGETGPGTTLRAAINSANSHAGKDTIQFSVAGTIAITSALPTLSGVVDIQGQTAPGASAGVPKVTIDCFNGGAPVAGLTITAGSCTINTLCIIRSNGNGILINTAGSNTIIGCYLGINTAGVASPNSRGIRITGTTKNIIGGTTAGERNIVSGNSSDGIFIDGSSPTGNKIKGNYIGVGIGGTAAVPNGGDGIELQNGADTTIIGGSASGAGNIISGNTAGGIRIGSSGGGGIIKVSIQGNYIGTNPAGAKLGNGANGIKFATDMGGVNTGTIIGAAGVPVFGNGEANTIAYNTGDGINFTDAGQKFISIRGNSMFCNQDKSIDLVGVGNETVAPPATSGTSAGTPSTANVARGTCAGTNLVDVYRNGSRTAGCLCEGDEYIGTATCGAVTAGEWSFTHNLNLPTADINSISATQTNGTKSTSPFGGCTAPVPLPITLHYFNADKSTEGVLITWGTLLEMNTSHFVIERSSNGRNWESIGSVVANGNRGNYSLVDESPEPGYNYYRLIEVDNVGARRDYAVDVVNIAADGLVFSVFPNPTSGRVTVAVSNDYPSYTMEIVNMNGVSLGQYQLVPGKNSIFVSDVSGVYFAKLKVVSQLIVQKIVIR